MFLQSRHHSDSRGSDWITTAARDAGGANDRPTAAREHTFPTMLSQNAQAFPKQPALLHRASDQMADAHQDKGPSRPDLARNSPNRLSQSGPTWGELDQARSNFRLGSPECWPSRPMFGRDRGEFDHTSEPTSPKVGGQRWPDLGETCAMPTGFGRNSGKFGQEFPKVVEEFDPARATSTRPGRMRTFAGSWPKAWRTRPKSG